MSYHLTKEINDTKFKTIAVSKDTINISIMNATNSKIGWITIQLKDFEFVDIVTNIDFEFSGVSEFISSTVDIKNYLLDIIQNKDLTIRDLSDYFNNQFNH